MNWLITGGCGYIGTSLIEALLLRNPGSNIRILDNLSVGTEKDLLEVSTYKKIKKILTQPEGIELFIGDITNDLDCINAAIGCDCIVHLAANTGVGPSVENPKLDMEANVIGVFNMLEAARVNKVRKFIFASSGAPIGELITPPIHEELPAHPVSPYGASKLAGEGYCSAYYHSFGVKTIALRFGNVYGPRSTHKASVVAKFIKLALNNEICEIYGSGAQTRDFIYISDLVDAIVKSSILNLGGEVFQIASGKEKTINELVEIIKKSFESRQLTLNVVKTKERLGDVMRNYSDTSKAKTILKWTPKMDLVEGINVTISWFMEHENK